MMRAPFLRMRSERVMDGFAPHHLFRDSGNFLGTLGRTEHVNRHTDSLGGGVSVEPLRASIPAGDDSVDVSGEDGVVGGFNHGGHLALDLAGAGLGAGTLAGEAGGKNRHGNKYHQAAIVIGGKSKTKARLKGEVIDGQPGSGGAYQRRPEARSNGRSQPLRR